MERRNLSSWRLGLLWLAAGLLLAPALGQGRIIIIDPPGPPPPPPHLPRPVPPPELGVPLAAKSLAIEAVITDGVAVTRVRQTFRNHFGRPIEGTYVFPLPAEAAVANFTMTINGQKMTGEVLDADQARQIYEDIVRRTRDPGLLEYLGARLYRARIFPIPPGGLAEIELHYSQTLHETGGLALFQHPLRGGGAPLEQLTLEVKLRSQEPLVSVFSPTHQCQIVRPNDREAQASFEQTPARLEGDFQLYYQRGAGPVGITVLTHRAAGEAGYFLLRLSPRIEINQAQIQPKDIAFVIDTSGSMQGGKIEQARQALRFCVQSLHPHDRFSIYAFSTAVRPFRDGLVPADAELKAAAVEFASKLEAAGGTNILGALLAALAADPRDEQRPYLIVFLTDGRPTVDVTSIDEILQRVADANSRRVRFHVLGVGTDVNPDLLDRLAEMNRGTREYCVENEELELKLSALARRLANPVLTDIILAVPGLQTADIYPQTLPDVFHGGDLVVLGRYEGHGEHAVQVRGRLQGDLHTLVSEARFPQRDPANDFLPRLWAQRKIAYLLDQMRLHGHNQELVDEVVRLAKRFGIVTPYTSALIVEDAERPVATPGQPPRTLSGPHHVVVDEARRQARAAGARGQVVVGGGGMLPASPAERIQQSQDLNAAQRLATADATVLRAAGGQTLARQIGAQTLVFDGQRWLDTAWDGRKPTTKITAFSDEYFKLLKEHPQLARVLALGEQVVVVVGERVYEVVPAGAPQTQPGGGK